jgi:hypothetical protein
MKRMKVYSAPTIDVVEVNLPCYMLSESAIEINGQVEDGTWNDLISTVISTETEESQVEDGAWNGL